MESSYQQDAVNFLVRSGTVIKIVPYGEVRGFPLDQNDRSLRTEYRVTLRRGEQTYTFPFYDSAERHKKANKRPSAYDILACLEKYPVQSDVWEFAREFGYTINDRKSFDRVSNIRAACEDQYNKLYRLFGKEWMNELRKIN